MAIEQNQNYLHTGEVEFQGGVKIVNGAEGVGKVLTSDASGNATWTSSSAGVLQSATVTITSAQILAIKTTPITLVAAQGVGTVICPIRAVAYIAYNSVPYATDITPIYYLGSSFTLTSLTNFLGYSSDVISTSTFGSSIDITATTENLPLLITTAFSNPTAGDSNVKITILYTVITL